MEGGFKGQVEQQGGCFCSPGERKIESARVGQNRGANLKNSEEQQCIVNNVMRVGENGPQVYSLTDQVDFQYNLYTEY